MKDGFGFLGDRLFLFCSALYALNRWWLKAAIHSAFLRNWFSDLLLAPCAIPLVLWIFRAVKVRATAERPSAVEMGWILAVWSILFEAAGPRLVRHAVGDWRDVVMYWAGGILAWGIWKLSYRENPKAAA